MVSKLNHQLESLLLGHPHSRGWKAEKRSCDLVLLRRCKGKTSGGFLGTLAFLIKWAGGISASTASLFLHC